MKKIFIPTALLAAIMATSIFPSCKKKDSEPTRSQLVVGTWKNTEQGNDVNNNGTWDTSEHHPFTPTTQFLFTFQAGGTGTASSSALPVAVPVTWSLQNNDQDFSVAVNYLGYQQTIQGNI